MGTIADKLQKLLSTKEAIKQAIIQQGVDISDVDTFSSYASKIQQIETGGTGGSEDWEIIDCSHLFRDTARLDKFDEIAAHIKKPTSFYYMFSQNSSSTMKKEIDMSKLGDTSEVADCERMFSNCAYIDYITNFGSFKSCTNMNHMFYGCTNLKDLDFKNVDFSSLDTASYMFYNCRNLKNIDMTLPVVRIISYMFSECSALENINIKNLFAGDNVVNISYIFYICGNIKELDFTDCNMTKVVNASSAFARMSNLETIKELELSDVTSTSNLNFLGSYAAPKLKTITFKQGTSFGRATITTEIILNLTRATIFDVDGYVIMMNSLGNNPSEYTRTIKLNTTLYNALTDEQKALATNKGYNLSYGTS